MPSVSLPTVALVATVGSAAISAYESHEQGEQVAAADKRKARVEQENEQQKQINMRQNMLKALAAQNAAAGAGNASVSKATTMRQITQAQNDLMISNANESAQVSLLDTAASNAVAAGNIGAVGDVLGAASSVAKNYSRGS